MRDVSGTPATWGTSRQGEYPLHLLPLPPRSLAMGLREHLPVCPVGPVPRLPVPGCQRPPKRVCCGDQSLSPRLRDPCCLEWPALGPPRGQLASGGRGSGKEASGQQVPRGGGRGLGPAPVGATVGVGQVPGWAGRPGDALVAPAGALWFSAVATYGIYQGLELL